MWRRAGSVASVSPPEKASIRSALEVPGFTPLATSYTINEIGDNLGTIALTILVYDHTGSALGTAALFLAAAFLPAFAAPGLIAALDRRAVGRVLTVLYLVEAVAFAAMALLAQNVVLGAILAIALLDGTAAVTARSLSRAAVVTTLQPRGLLREGNSIINVAFAVSSAAGPAAAGLLVAGGGVATALWLDAVSFLLVAMLLAWRGALIPSAPADDEGAWSQRMRNGLAYVRDEPVLHRLIGGQALAYVFFFLVVPIEVVFVKETLDGSSLDYGLLLTAWGSGILAGSALFARLRRSPLRALVIASTAAVGLGYVGLAAAPTLLLACAASVVGGVGNGMQLIAVVTAVQEAVADEYQARVAGVLQILASVIPGAAFLAGGLVAELWSPRVAYAVAGIGVLTVAVAFTSLPSRIAPRRERALGTAPS